MSDLGPSRCGC